MMIHVGRKRCYCNIKALCEKQRTFCTNRPLHTTSDRLIFDESDINENDELRILFIEITKMSQKEQDNIKEMMRAMIIQAKTRELVFKNDIPKIS